MSNFNTISAILRGRWLIDKQYAEAHLPFVKNILTRNNEKNAGGVDITGIDAIRDKNLSMFPCAGVINAGVFTKSRWNSFNDAPNNSIAIINISGPIMKNGGECGEPGAMHYTNWIKAANIASNIAGILLVIDTPGGMVDGTQTVADAIKNSQKPVVGFIDDGMMASAGTWIGTSALEVYSSHKTNTIGSIGVYSTIYDYRDWLKAEGLVEHTIYAEQSTDKNKAYYEAIDGKYSLYQKELNQIADEFINAVKENRGSRLNTTKNNPFTGKMYNSDDAIEIGLIDGYATIEQAVNRIYELAKKEEFGA